MRVLIACEQSGVVREAFARVGCDAWSCDIEPTRQPGQHIQDNCLNVLDDGWDLLIAHPPCTYLANSGVRWLYTQPGRMEKMVEAAAFFRRLLDAPIPHVAVENPIMHSRARQHVARAYAQIVQPWWFGHGWTKATCLWLRNLPALQATNPVSGREPRILCMAPGPQRQYLRSITPQGLADAMASQWLPALAGHASRSARSPGVPCFRSCRASGI